MQNLISKCFNTQMIFRKIFIKLTGLKWQRLQNQQKHILQQKKCCGSEPAICLGVISYSKWTGRYLIISPHKDCWSYFFMNSKIKHQHLYEFFFDISVFLGAKSGLNFARHSKHINKSNGFDTIEINLVKWYFVECTTNPYSFQA